VIDSEHDINILTIGWEGNDMQHYRAFQLDYTGHVIGRIDLSCLDDEDAMKQAQRLLDFYDIELWRLDRRVALLKSDKARH
jgi:hypothetical protein